jgi:phage major head subunit gpT-like protein
MKEGECMKNTQTYSYVNGKLPGMCEWRKKRMMEEMKSSMAYLIYCKNLCKCHNVPPAQQ